MRSALVLAEPWWVGGAMRLGGWCQHLEGEQRHQNAPKMVPLHREGAGEGPRGEGNGCTQAV